MRIETAKLGIIHYPDPRLRTRCRMVETMDESLAPLAERMFALMREQEGIGLAAPQVGLDIRLFVCNHTGDPKDDQIYVNARLSDLTGAIDSEEGCLSIPDVRGTIRRYQACTIRAFDLKGRPVERRAEDLLARCWQHECDHLDGRLIIDRMSEAERIANRKALKELELKFKRRGRAG